MSDITKENEKLIIKSITSSSDERVISTLLDLKESGKLFILETILDMVVKDRSDLLKKSIIEFASDIKDKKATPILVDFLKKSFPEKKVIEVLTICWQSRLDFSNDLDIFFQILKNGDYQTAFEAFTVIENSLENISREDINNRITFLKRGFSKADRDKQLLILEMVSVLNKKKGEA